MGSPLVLWDVATRKRLFDLEGLSSDCQYIHFSPDTKMIAAADDHGFFIWDLDTGDLVLSQKPAAGQAFSTFAWGSIHEGRSKRNASYLIATTSASTLLMHLLMFDVKTMHYVLQTSNMQLPSRGFVRRYVRTQFSDNFEQVFCATREGDLGVFNVPNSIFRTTLNVRLRCKYVLLSF
jgi:WD40 repeat protein